MTRVKVCGITRVEDAQAAARAGASAIGMVFWPSSPRAVSIDAARAIVAALPAGVPAIGVFVNQPVEEINGVVDAAGLFGVQLHGDEPAAMIPRIKRPVIRAAKAEAASAIDELPAHVTVLLDAVDPERRGGTGRTVDWEAAARIARRRPIVLAGGLTAANVEEAIGIVRPYAVDVSSGVEISPGIKDHDRIRAFIAAVHRADRIGSST